MNAYDINQAFLCIEDELISSLMRNMERHRAEETEYGFNWPAWQAEQLKALERYRVENKVKFASDYVEINRSLEVLIQHARTDGGMKEEIKILKKIQNGYKINGKNRPSAFKKSKLSGAFFQSNDKKLEALIKATTRDFEKAETAMLRRANDRYREIIYKAQVYANTGAATYVKAVDMAAKDFLRAGIDCIEYKNGARHTISDYAAMAIRTANKRAALMGAGEKRNKWGIRTVIVNNRAAPCERCLPFVGVVFIDDVWSGGSRKDGGYPLLSAAISAGLFHPNCKDGTSTYYPGITPIPSKYSKVELDEIMERAKQESREKYSKRQAQKYERLSKHALDEENKKAYTAKAKEWTEKASHCSILKEVEKEGVLCVGTIDRTIYNCITDDFITEEVIITDNQIQHIADRHPGDYEKIAPHLENLLSDPDYIIADKQPNTGLVIKEIGTKDENIQVVLKIVTSKDDPGYKNSIITGWIISDKRLQNYLNNKRILYKRE